MLLNLLSNAIKFSHSNSSVTVFTGLEEREEGDTVIKILVQDYGIGIRQEDQNNLFLPFSKSKDSASAKLNPNGNGLGLYMSKQICIAAGGEMMVTSQPAFGSNFSFTMVVKPVPKLSEENDTTSSAISNIKR